MSLINCPECGHEVSTSATECPNCGRPVHRPVEHPRTVVTAVPREKKDFPSWVFIPLGILGVLLLLVLFLVMSRNNEDDSANTNINISAKRAATETRVPARTDSQVVTVPPSSDAQTVTVPPSQTTTTTVPGSGGGTVPAPADTKGTVVIDAKIATRAGTPQAVRNEKFYLLDKDLEIILSEANLEPIEGQSLMNSLGLAVMYPDRYGDFQRAALNAINRHIKYSTKTDGAGKGQIKDIKPDSYYLFGVTRTGKGFAVWSSPVSINAGENILNLSPQPLTEISE